MNGSGASPPRSALLVGDAQSKNFNGFLVPNKQMVQMLSGAVSGMTAVFIAHPFDSLKVWLQNSQATDPRTITQTLKTEGVSALFRGIGAPLTTVAFTNSLFFTSATNFKLISHRSTLIHPNRNSNSKSNSTGDEPTVLDAAIGGSAAGFVLSWVLTPRDVVKTRLQCSSVLLAKKPTSAITPSGSFGYLKYVLRNHGIKGMYRGLSATMARDVPGDAFYFGVYDFAKKKLTPLGQAQPNAAGQILAGGLAGVAFWSSIFPLDTIKTRLQAQDPVHPAYSGIMDCGKRIVAEKGIGGLYTGYTITLIRAFPISAINFFVFEKTFAFLQTLLLP